MSKFISETEKEWLSKKLRERFGCGLPEGKILCKEEKKTKKYFLFSGKCICENAQWVGLNILNLDEDGICPTIEGAQLMADASKNVTDISYPKILAIFRGQDIENKQNPDGYVILKFGDRILGVGKAEGKKITSMVPKSRRISSSKRFYWEKLERYF